MSERTEYTSEVAAALDAVEGLVEVEPLEDTGILAVVTRSTAHRLLVNTETWAESPRRPRGTITAATAEGFVTAVEIANDAGRTVIYAGPDTCELVAVLNDAVSGAAGWRDYRVALSLKPTPEWAHWTGRQGLGSQEKFATTIEEGEAEIVEPSATYMLDLAQTFHATTSAKFKQAGRLQDGRTQFTYEDEIDAKAGTGGALSIPSDFLLGLRPFFGADRYTVKARLRYRLSRDGLQIGYQLHRPDDVRRLAFGDVVAQVREALALPLVYGSPAAPATAVTP